MSEVTFCKSFLTALDARPIKLSSDHIADARQYPAQSAHTLPRLPHPPHPARPNPQSASDASFTISITLKPMKSLFPTHNVPSIDASKLSIFDLKQQYATAASLSAAKVKILYKKKPVLDSKTVAEVIGSDVTGNVEFSVMVIGAAAVAPVEMEGTPVDTLAATPGGEDVEMSGIENLPAVMGPNGKEVVATGEFWSDLKTFMMQRIKNEVEAERLVNLFEEAWEKDK